MDGSIRRAVVKTWIAGTSPAMTVEWASTITRILCGPGEAVVLLRTAEPIVPPSQCEGNGAPAGAPSSLSALRRKRVLRSTRSPPGAPLRRFLSRGPRFRGRGDWPVPVQRAPRGGVIVPPDRVPRPPGCVAANHARGRRTIGAGVPAPIRRRAIRRASPRRPTAAAPPQDRL